MSILFNPIDPATLPWLDAAACKVYEIEDGPFTGSWVEVRITQKKADINEDGVIDEMIIFVSGRLVEKEGPNAGETIVIGQTPAKVTLRNHKEPYNKIATGEVDLAAVTANLTVASINQMMVFRAALEFSSSQIPVEE